MTPALWIKTLVVIQFALAAAVPCQCVMQDYSATNSGAGAVAAACCAHGSCKRANATAEDASASDHRCRAKAPHRNACPGRPLPELSPPPSTPGDDLLSTLRYAPTHGDSTFVAAVLLTCGGASPFALPVRAAPNIGAQSLLRQHCALII